MAKKSEGKFQAELRKEIEEMFPGSLTLKNDSSDIQGIPDLTVIYKDKWAMLEVKESAKASYRPNQKYYIETLGKNSFVRSIYPENKQEVLRDLQQTFGA